MTSVNLRSLALYSTAFEYLPLIIANSISKFLTNIRPCPSCAKNLFDSAPFSSNIIPPSVNTPSTSNISN